MVMRLRISIAFLNEVGQVALSAVVPVEVHGHEDSRTAHLVGALATKARHLVVGIHLVEFKHCELDLFPFVLDFLWFRVRFFFPFFASSGQLHGHEHGGLIHDAASIQEVRRLQ